MIVFYHNDNDGKASAWCVLRYNTQPDDGRRESIAMDYGDEFPFGKIRQNEYVWIVDYHIPPSDMDRLLKITPNVTWIDHHATSIEKYKNYDKPIRGWRKDGEAACSLVWKFVRWYTFDGAGDVALSKDGNMLYPIARKQLHPLPRSIELCADFDVWTKLYGDETANFTAASESYDTSPDKDFWDKCLDPQFMANLQVEGKLIVRYKSVRDKALREAIGYDTEFEGYKAFAMNLPKTNSISMGGDEMFERYDLLIPYYHDGEQFSFSIYTAGKIDGSAISKKYGGGGHIAASGFTAKEIPFKKKQKGAI